MMLRVQDLAIARGGLPVLDNLSFALEPGQALILRGANGIGKTTLLRTLAGLQPPLHGLIEGADQRVAYAAHSDGLKPTLTVTENLQFWARIFGTGTIDAALEAYDLHGLAERPIWILDEPTVSLDTSAVAMFAGAVRDHLKRGGSALIATHIDLGLDAEVLDLAPFRATLPALDDFDGAFT